MNIKLHLDPNYGQIIPDYWLVAWDLAKFVAIRVGEEVHVHVWELGPPSHNDVLHKHVSDELDRFLGAWKIDRKQELVSYDSSTCRSNPEIRRDAPRVDLHGEGMYLDLKNAIRVAFGLPEDDF